MQEGGPERAVITLYVFVSVSLSLFVFSVPVHMYAKTSSS